MKQYPANYINSSNAKHSFLDCFLGSSSQDLVFGTDREIEKKFFKARTLIIYAILALQAMLLHKICDPKTKGTSGTQFDIQAEEN